MISAEPQLTCRAPNTGATVLEVQNLSLGL
jgi:hypothetical protein